MGGRFSCGWHCGWGQCEHCICSRADKCISLCHRNRQQKPVVHTLAAMHEDSLPLQPEKYQLLGTETLSKHLICSDFGPPLGPENPMPAAGELPMVTDLPNIGEMRHITTLEDECRFNPSKLRKIKNLAKNYHHWRPIRGDGNCYYRAVIYGMLELCFTGSDDRQRLGEVLSSLERVQYDSLVHQCNHERVLQLLRSWQSREQLEVWVSNDASVDQALVRACRRLVREFLTQHADEPAPSGMTYSELVHALDATYAGVEDFCLHVVDPMGRDAETLVLDALPLQAGIGVRMWILDRREGTDLVSLDTPGPNGSIDVHVLFKPGHYDLLYPRDVPKDGTGHVLSADSENDSSLHAMQLPSFSQDQQAEETVEMSPQSKSLPGHNSTPRLGPAYPDETFTTPLTMPQLPTVSRSLKENKTMFTPPPSSASSTPLSLIQPPASISLSQATAGNASSIQQGWSQEQCTSHLRLPVCEVPPYVQAASRISCDHQHASKTLAMETTSKAGIASSCPQLSEALGCNTGITFSLSALWQAALATWRHPSNNSHRP
mmetsp:Transcript_26664/g.51398  ORF Transcript_26664/g.51398 Transcript_26664/m.51398 type:complete len:547 (+) Transcript_26664:42-1682(+)